MKLTVYQISKIKYRMHLSNNLEIVMVNVSTDKNMNAEESSRNIYCIDNENEIIWQVKDIKKRPFDDDMFAYLKEFPKDTIYAVRFSGFEYNIDPKSGEATCIGFRKA